MKRDSVYYGEIANRLKEMDEAIQIAKSPEMQEAMRIAKDPAVQQAYNMS